MGVGAGLYMHDVS